MCIKEKGFERHPVNAAWKELNYEKGTESMNTKRIKAAILGPGNIGTDLMIKILKRSRYIELELMCGILANSTGLELARQQGIKTSSRGIEDILSNNEIKIVFDATTASAHLEHAPLLRKNGIIAIDLTPAAVGPYVVPVVNMENNINEPNLNLITCGGQATIPIVKAISRVVDVPYAEIVAVIASKSAGPGTRQSIDEFTQTTAKGLIVVGGAKKGKAIILLNPAVPPMRMNNTIYTAVSEFKEKLIMESVNDMVKQVQEYVPGYQLKIPPSYDGERVVTMIEIEGAGDYLPKYSGNLDIETAAALSVGERMAMNMILN